MTQLLRGGRPIIDQDIQRHYQCHEFNDLDLKTYTNTWRRWLTTCTDKTLLGLDDFGQADFVHGTSQTFDHFVIKHSCRTLRVWRGEFQYHACVTRHGRFRYIDRIDDLTADDAIIISVPFSDFGYMHPEFFDMLAVANRLEIPVCLDLAYWGVAKNVDIDLRQWPCIREITSSLSKCFFTLETHRVGIRFTRQYQNDGISMLNEVGMQNSHSMSLAKHYMDTFSNWWCWSKYSTTYDLLCKHMALRDTDTVIFALGDVDRHADFNRGIADNFRVCVSNQLRDLYHDNKHP